MLYSNINFYVIMVLFYLQGIPESAEVPVPVARFSTSQTTESGAAPAAPVSGAPNSSPLNMFPQVKRCIVDVLQLHSKFDWFFSDFCWLLFSFLTS